MITPEERLRVLQMIEDGKISAAEGASMLCCGEDPNFPKPSEQPNSSQTPRWIRVMVTDLTSGKTRVNVKLPANLMSTGLKMGAHLSTDMHELNMQQINDYIRRGVTGQVLEVVDDDEGEKVAIYLE
jgi:hypothetical protein